MMEALSAMWWPLLACLVLVGIHAYLGIHVIARKVIFVDLALAQMAALGAVFGVSLGLSLAHDPWAIKLFSVFFTLVGAGLFAFTRPSDERIPHEVIIGIIYATALSLTIVLTIDLPHGGDEVRQMLAGNILWVSPEDVGLAAGLYAVIGLIHLLFHKQFLRVEAEIPRSRGLMFWDFFFYATFGVVVTSSVGMAGVLLVFGYLVIPSVIGIIFASSMAMRLFIGWGSGALMSILGVLASYYLDLPSGPTIVVFLALFLLLLFIGKEVASRSSRRNGLLHLLVTASLLALLAIFSRSCAHEEASTMSEEHQISHGLADEAQLKKLLSSTDRFSVINALNAIKEQQLRVLLPEVLFTLSSKDAQLRELAITIVGDLGDGASGEKLYSILAEEKDEFISIEIGIALLKLKDTRGLMVLRNIMIESPSELARDDAELHLVEWLKGAPSERAELGKWLLMKQNNFEFDEKLKKYFIAQ